MAVDTTPKRERMEPLWDRVDRNRLKLTAFVIVFVLGSALGMVAVIAVPLFLIALYNAETWQSIGDSLTVVLGSVAFVGIAAASTWAGVMLLRSEKWLLKRFDATLVPTGELLDTKFALKDMAIAAGLPHAPALWVMEDTSTNAFVFAARRRRAVIGVTRGFLGKLTIDQQRAVFANLIARLASGDTIVSTGVTALMWPMHAWRLSRLTAEDRALEEALKAESAAQAAEVQRRGDPLVAFIVFGAGFVLLAEVVAAGHRRAQLTTAEKADAEGMLLLKDPTVMLSALKRCIELNNVVPAAGEAFAELFYCWTGISTDDEDDPEWQRVVRLREVLGVMGHEPEPVTWAPEVARVAPWMDEGGDGQE